MSRFAGLRASKRFDRACAGALAGLLWAATQFVAGPAHAKLPPPTDEAKAKAAEAAAKTAWSNKVADYQLCKAQDKVAAKAMADMKRAGKEVKPATATPPCADPGPFVYTPPVPAPAVAAAPTAAAAPPAAAAAPAAVAGKK